MLSLLWPRVQSLVRELSSLKPRQCSQKSKKIKKQKIKTRFSIVVLSPHNPVLATGFIKHRDVLSFLGHELKFYH